MNSVLVIDSDPASAKKIASALTRSRFRMVVALGDKSETEVYSSNLEVPTDWDYYMQLPANYDELAARINVLLWRYGKGEMPGATVIASPFASFRVTNAGCYSEGAKVVAGFIPALVGDKPRPYKIATAMSLRAEGVAISLIEKATKC